jgi:hypothetical protein
LTDSFLRAEAAKRKGGSNVSSHFPCTDDFPEA